MHRCVHTDDNTYLKQGFSSGIVNSGAYQELKAHIVSH